MWDYEGQQDTIHGTTQFWGGPHRRFDYDHGKLCPMCLIEDPPTFTLITNGASLCMHHAQVVRRKTERQVARLLELHRQRKEQARFDAIARDCVPRIARVEE